MHNQVFENSDLERIYFLKHKNAYDTWKKKQHMKLCSV